MTKIVVNVCYGGFGLSPEASELLNKKKNLKKGDKHFTNPEHGYLNNITRHDKHLIEVVEELEEKANGRHADLIIVEAEGYQYRIEEYDGNESLETPETEYWNIIDTPDTRDRFPEAFL